MIDLSRDEGVTIFLSTHFMNEAERCDRISLMHAGKVLAVGAPMDLVKERGSDSLEDTFVGYLADAAGIDRTKKVEAPPPDATPTEAEPIQPPRRFDIARLWAYARRETVELLRDPIRLVFSVLGPIILMLAFGYGISFDVEDLQMASFDHDNTPQSRHLLDGFAGSRYFSVQPPIRSAAEADRRLRSGNTQIVVEVPAGFGRDSGFRHHCSVGRAGGEFLRTVSAGVFALGHCENCRPDVPIGLVSDDHRRRVRQGAGNVRPLV